VRPHFVCGVDKNYICEGSTYVRANSNSFVDVCCSIVHKVIKGKVVEVSLGKNFLLG